MHGHPKENEPATRRWAIADPGNRRRIRTALQRIDFDVR